MEQYHCHGLRSCIKSCECECERETRGYDSGGESETYSKEGHIAVRAVDVGGEMPGVPISQSGNEGLQDTGSGNDNGRADGVSWGEDGGEAICSHVGA